MKKSQAITLTVVAAVALATAQGQTPAGSPDPNDCNEILRNSGAGAPIPARCVARAHNGYIGAHGGGFGAIGQGRHHGG